MCVFLPMCCVSPRVGVPLRVGVCPLFVCTQDSHLGLAAVDAFDEYLVPPALLDRLATLTGLAKECSENFHRFFTRTAGAHKPLLQRNSVLDWQGRLSLPEWETAGGCRRSPPPHRALPFPAQAFAHPVFPDLPPENCAPASPV